MESKTFEHTFIIDIDKNMGNITNNLIDYRRRSYTQCGSIPCHSSSLVETLITSMALQSQSNNILLQYSNSTIQIIMMSAQFIGKYKWFCHKLSIEWFSIIEVSFHGERDDRIEV